MFATIVSPLPMDMVPPTPTDMTSIPVMLISSITPVHEERKKFLVTNIIHCLIASFDNEKAPEAQPTPLSEHNTPGILDAELSFLYVQPVSSPLTYFIMVD